MKKRGLKKGLIVLSLLLLISTLLFATQKTLTVTSMNGQFESIRDSDWFWTDTELVSKVSAQLSEYPELITDSAGNLHVVWIDQTDYLSSGTDRDVFYRRWKADTHKWAVTQVISEGGFDAYVPDLAVDSADNLHVVWQENDNILHRKWTAATQSWSSITLISTESIAGSNNPDIGIDSSDNIHVVWSDESDILDADPDMDIFYKIWNDTKQAWSTAQLVSTESNDGSYVPALVIDSIGNVHVTWADDADYLIMDADRDIFYKYLDASTKVWQPVEILSNESNYMATTNPDIVVDSLDNLHVVWEDASPFFGSEGDTDIFYRVYDEELGYWRIPDVISDAGEAQSWNPYITIDLDDNIHVTWEDGADYYGSDTDTDILYRMFSSNKEAWSSIEVVSTDSTSSSRFVSIAVSKYGSLNVIWQDYTNMSYWGNDVDIFFKRFIGPPAEPILASIVPDQIGTDMLQLNWNDAKGVKRYYIYRDENFIMSVDHLDPISSTSTNSLVDVLPDTGIYYYVVVAENVHFNSPLSNCIAVEYTVAHIREFVIPISILTIIAVLVLTMRIKRKRNRT